MSYYTALASAALAVRVASCSQSGHVQSVCTENISGRGVCLQAGVFVFTNEHILLKYQPRTTSLRIVLLIILASVLWIDLQKKNLVNGIAYIKPCWPF